MHYNERSTEIPFFLFFSLSVCMNPTIFAITRDKILPVYTVTTLLTYTTSQTGRDLWASSIDKAFNTAW